MPQGILTMLRGVLTGWASELTHAETQEMAEAAVQTWWYTRHHSNNDAEVLNGALSWALGSRFEALDRATKLQAEVDRLREEVISLKAERGDVVLG